MGTSNGKGVRLDRRDHLQAVLEVIVISRDCVDRPLKARVNARGRLKFA